MCSLRKKVIIDNILLILILYQKYLSDISHNNVFTEARINKLRLYNMSSVGEERRWLQDILLSDSSDSSASGSDTDSQITEDDFQEMLKFHILRKKYQGRFYQKPEVKIINIIIIVIQI